MDRSLLEQQRQYLLLSEKPVPILLALVNLTKDREGGRRQMNLGVFQDYYNFLKVKLFRFLFPLILVQYYYSVTNAFQPAFLK